MKRGVAIGLIVGAAAMILLGAGATAGVLVADDADDVAALRAQVAALEERVAAAEREAAVLRAQRNALEARLAAGDPPAVCPRPFLSTGALLPHAAFDHPCGWHVVADAFAGEDDPERPGLVVTLTLLGRLPIALSAPPPIADVELADWSDDPADDRDALEPLDAWVADERARFTATPEESQFEGGSGITVVRLEGTQSIEGRDAAVAVLLWEFTDTLAGARHVMRAVAVEPGAEALRALDAIARTFAVRRQ